MQDKTKSEKKDKPKANLPRPASSVAAASNTDGDQQQVPVTQMEEALKNMQNTINTMVRPSGGEVRISTILS